MVLGPAIDGGYYLIGTTEAHPELLQVTDCITEAAVAPIPARFGQVFMIDAHSCTAQWAPVSTSEMKAVSDLQSSDLVAVPQLSTASGAQGR